MGSRTNNRINAISVTEAATVRLVRLIVKQIKTLEANGVSAEENRRFVARVVDAASDGVREQLKSEGTWI
jgi:hypothetical protein